MKGGNTDKKWFFLVIGGTMAILAAIAAVMTYVDPLFHYHAPIKNLSYPLYQDQQRYINDGIVKHFEYDTIITGTSLTENFKTSECDEILGTVSIKIPYSGGLYKEVNDTLKCAFEANPDIQNVIRCLDYDKMIFDKDAERYEGYPVYLTNKNPFDDVQYVLNKFLLKNVWDVLRDTRAGKSATTFDEYSNWQKYYPADTFGREAVLATYYLGKKEETARILTEKEKLTVQENIRQNVTDLAKEHPETTFYLFFPPYSICYWDVLNQNGELVWRIEQEKYAIEEMLQCPNIKLFSFCTNDELVCNLDNYKDILHYGEWVNTQILEWMSKDEYLLTEDNYEDYLEEITEFYTNFDYSSLHQE